MQNFVLAFALVILSACAAQNPKNAKDPNHYAAPIYPAIGLFSARASDALLEECKQHEEQSSLAVCAAGQFDIYHLASQLKTSGAFASVGTGVQSEFEIVVSSITKSKSSVGDIGKGALAGASLFLIPITMNETLKVGVTITWRNAPIASFTNEIPIQYKLGLLSEVSDSYTAAADAIATLVLAFLEENTVLTGAHVLSVLKASDYENDMVFPELLDNFHFQEKYIYPDPFYGAQLRFAHNQFAFDVADVFVYSIRSVNWNNHRDTVSKEVSHVWNELEYMQKKGHLSALAQGTRESLDWHINGTAYQGEFLQTRFVSADKKAINSMTYVFIKHDKFLKVRASFVMNENAFDAVRPDAFVKAMLAELKPPGESEFMQDLRFKESRTVIQ